MTDILVNGAGLLLAVFIVGWFWLSSPSGKTDENEEPNNIIIEE